jgi:hypothetical protein
VSTPGKERFTPLQLIIVITAAVCVLGIGATFGLWKLVTYDSVEAEHVRRPSPVMTDPAVSPLRDAAVASMEAEFSAIADQASLRSGPSGAATSCVEGQHNWYVNEDYDYRCSVASAHLYGWSDGFAAVMTRIDAVMTKDGWTGDGPGAIGDYQQTVTTLLGKGYSPARAEASALNWLQPVGYHRAGEWVTFTFVGTTNEGESFYPIDLGDGIDSRAAVAEILASGPVVEIRTIREFYRV